MNEYQKKVRRIQKWLMVISVSCAVMSVISAVLMDIANVIYWGALSVLNYLTLKLGKGELERMDKTDLEEFKKNLEEYIKAKR